jgi:hypothetical protein
MLAGSARAASRAVRLVDHLDQRGRITALATRMPTLRLAVPELGAGTRTASPTPS